MYSKKYIFSQRIDFLPKRVFDGLASKYSGGNIKHFSCWNQLLVMMFGQLTLAPADLSTLTVGCNRWFTRQGNKADG